MTRYNGAFHVYIYIRNARFAKKKKIYKQVLALTIDLTTAIYSAAFIGYLFVSMFVFGDVMQELGPYFQFIEENAGKGYWILLSVLPIRSVLKAFREPGVLFSSSEYQLSILPFKKSEIWVLVLLEKWLRQTLLLGLGAIIFIVLTPISGSLIFSYVLLITVYNLIMAVPQWKLFQQRFWVKAGWLVIFLVCNAVAGLFASSLIGVAQFVLLLLAHLWLIPLLFKKVNWEKVTEISDYHIWNMQVVSMASKTKFKKKKAYSIFQNTARHKRAFATTSAIYHRLWKLYFAKNAEVIMQVIGAVLLMLIVFQFLQQWVFYVGAAAAIYIYAALCANLFHNRFQTDVVEVLPWDLQMYKQTYFKWMVIGGGVLLIPVLAFFVRYWDVWAPLKLIFFLSVFIYDYYLKMDKAIILLAKAPVSIQLREGLSILFFALLVISHFLPFVSLVSFGVVWFLRRKSSIFLSKSELV